MAVNLVTEEQFTVSGGSVSRNYVGANSNVVFICFQSAPNSSTPPTYGGVNFTLYGQVGFSYGSPTYLWYLTNPLSGSQTFQWNGYGTANIYIFNGMSEGNFIDTVVTDFSDNVNAGCTITPGVSNGYLIFFQQASSGAGNINLTNGQTNKEPMGFGATSIHSSPGAGNSYDSTCSYGPNIGPFDNFGMSFIPASATTTSTTMTTSTTTTSSSTSSTTTISVSTSTTTTSSSSTSSSSTSHSTSTTTTSSSTTTTSISTTSTLSSSTSVSTTSTTTHTISSSTTLTIPVGATDTKRQVFIGKTREH